MMIMIFIFILLSLLFSSLLSVDLMVVISFATHSSGSHNGLALLHVLVAKIFSSFAKVGENSPPFFPFYSHLGLSLSCIKSGLFLLIMCNKGIQRSPW